MHSGAQAKAFFAGLEGPYARHVRLGMSCYPEFYYGLYEPNSKSEEGWEQGVRVAPARAPPEVADRVIPPSPAGYGGQAELWLDDPFPDYDTEPVMAYANG